MSTRDECLREKGGEERDMNMNVTNLFSQHQAVLVVPSISVLPLILAAYLWFFPLVSITLTRSNHQYVRRDAAVATFLEGLIVVSVLNFA